MSAKYVHSIPDATKGKNLDAMPPQMADEVIPKSQLACEPFQVKAPIRPVVESLLELVDEFDFLEAMQGVILLL